MKYLIIYILCAVTTLSATATFTAEYKSRSPMTLTINGGNTVLDFGTIANKNPDTVILQPTFVLTSSNFAKTITLTSSTGGAGFFSKDSTGFYWTWDPDLGRGGEVTGGLTGGHMNVNVKLPYSTAGGDYNNFNPTPSFSRVLLIELVSQFDTDNTLRDFSEVFTWTITYNP